MATGTCPTCGNERHLVGGLCLPCRALGNPYTGRSNGDGAGVLDTCYGRTAAGTPCQGPPGHYPATKHYITMGDDGRSFMAWTDEAMADFQRIANELFNAEHPDA